MLFGRDARTLRVMHEMQTDDHAIAQTKLGEVGGKDSQPCDGEEKQIATLPPHKGFGMTNAT